MTASRKPDPPLTFRSWLPAGQLIRYVVVGGWNTAFGYGVFALLNYWLTGHIAYPYMVANAISTVTAITVAYFGHKFIVFRTKGNYLREYLRFYMVYGAAALLGFVLLPLFVLLCGLFIFPAKYVPYVAQALVIPVIVLFSFLGHKRFSFRRRANLRPDDPRQ